MPRQKEEEEKNCDQGFGKNESLLPLLKTKDKIEVPLQKTKGKGLDMLILNELADPLDMEFLELLNHQLSAPARVLLASRLGGYSE